MPEIAIRFIRGAGWDSRIIEHRQRSWCSHTEACTLFSATTFGAMLRGGVRERWTSDSVYRGVTRKETWRIPVSDEARDAFWKFLREQIRKPYDWRAIVSFGLGERDWRTPDSWFCSELMIAALEAASVVHFAGESHVDRIDPGTAYLLVTSLPLAYKV